MRMPAASGFYPLHRKVLEKMLEGFREDMARDKTLKAGISPHAGYVFSGRLASKLYQAMEADKFLILGVNHHGLGERIAKSEEDWWTPFGPVRVDSSLPVPADELAHVYEHSIEVQLPLIKYFVGDFVMTPVSLYSLSFREIKGIASAILEWHSGEAIIASSDFTHYGPDYGYDIFSGELDDIFEKAREMDEEMVELILDLKPKKFYDKAMQRTICGFIPITVLMLVAKEKGWSGRIVGFDSSFLKLRQRNFVNYYAISFHE